MTTLITAAKETMYDCVEIKVGEKNMYGPLLPCVREAFPADWPKSWVPTSSPMAIT